jgi:hypothetical protein
MKRAPKDPVAAARREYEAAYAEIDHATQIGERENVTGPLKQELRVLVHRVGALLGHIALRQGAEVQCSKCSRSGRVSEKLTGAVHTERCE